MEILPELMHAVKHEKNIASMVKSLTSDSKEWCPFMHNKQKKTNLDCYSETPILQHIINVLDNLCFLFDLLELEEEDTKELIEAVEKLKHPHKIKDWVDFKILLEDIERILKRISPEISKKIKKFTCLECERIWEGIRCFYFQSYYASTILIVSALESRLHTLIKNKNKTLYKKEINGSTFGKILDLRDPDKYKAPKYKKIKSILLKMIPEKHMPLMRLLNYYRILSAHANPETIEKNVAKSIITLSFAFLLDESLKIPEKACDNHGHAPFN